MLIELLIFFCAMVGTSLWKFLIRGTGEKKVKKHCCRPIKVKAHDDELWKRGSGNRVHLVNC